MIKIPTLLLNEENSLEALISRLPEKHMYQKFLKAELHRQSAGIRGEQRLMKKLEEFECEEDLIILSNINLTRGKLKIQMDSLLLTDSCAIIIESKNINGKIHFEEDLGEFFRFNNEGEKTVMEDPTIQLKRNMRFYDEWLKAKNIILPVKGLIVFTSKNCEFISKPQNTPICKTYQLHHYLHNLLLNPPIESSVNIKKLKKMLHKEQTPYRRSPLCEYYRIEPLSLKRGIRCAACGTVAEGNLRRMVWHCTKCGIKDSNSLNNAVSEYFSLISQTVTNREFRDFYTLDSRHIASRILTKHDLEVSGELKNRRYHFKHSP